MNLLIIHQNFPGQFRHIALHMVAQGHRVIGLGSTTAPGLEGVTVARYALKRKPLDNQHRYLRPLEKNVIYGQAVAEALITLKREGFVPDVVLAHSGWGEALYVKDVFPATKLVCFFEYFYRSVGADADFDQPQPLSLDDHARIRTRNAFVMMSLDVCDVGISPTHWQKSLFPAVYQHKIDVIHEGVDVNLMTPDSRAEITLPDGHVFKYGDAVVTYVARNLEPYRGFHVFMRSLSLLLAAHSSVHVVIVGGDDVSYGSKAPGGVSWREAMLAEVGDVLDLSRVHFTGKLPYLQYRCLLQVSAAHVYLTYPFVLSWSMLEAMSCGCVVIGSKTTPVEEVVTHGENGLLVDFHDQAGLVDQIVAVLNAPQSFMAIRRRARETAVQGYALRRGLQEYARVL